MISVAGNIERNMVQLLMNYESFVLYVCVSNAPVFVASASISLHVTYDNPRIVFFTLFD